MDCLLWSFWVAGAGEVATGGGLGGRPFVTGEGCGFPDVFGWEGLWVR